ncbi:MAG: LTA synthase family protein [Alistipes sp.]
MKALRYPIFLLLWRILLLYIVLMLCRLIFFCYNATLIGSLSEIAWWPMLCGALKFDTVSILYANGPLIILSLLPFHFRERKWYQNTLYGCYLTVNSFLLIAVNLADCVYFHYTQKRFTADEIFFANNANSPQLVLQFAVENWYLVLFGVVLIALLAWGGVQRSSGKASRSHKSIFYYPLHTLILALTIALSLGGIRGGFTRMTRPITLSNATLYADNSAQANLILSNPFCILRTIGSSGSVKVPPYFNEPQLSTLFTPYHHPASDTTALFKGRNVMIFILESMSAEHSALLCPTLYAQKTQKGYTPFLDSLMGKGFTFKHMYSNGLQSIQAIPAVLGSIPSFKTPFPLMPQSLGKSRQLPQILRDKGYATAFLCGSERGSMGFGAYARSAGIDQLFAREDYEARHGTGDFDGYWGIWDEPFLQFTGEELAQLPEPFFATLFTLSAHHPFLVPSQYEKALPVGETKVQRGAAYDDLAFRHFFERFHNEAWFQRTVFVFVADHVSSERYGKVSHTWPGDHHIISFIYTPDGALKGEYTSVAQQIDLMPTLLGLLGNDEPYFAFGRDVLNETTTPWSVGYGNTFRAVTDDLLVTFDDQTQSIAKRDATTPLTAADSLHAQLLTEQLKALIQQYYTHLARKSYVVEND